MYCYGSITHSQKKTLRSQREDASIQPGQAQQALASVFFIRFLLPSQVLIKSKSYINCAFGNDDCSVLDNHLLFSPLPLQSGFRRCRPS